MCCRILFLLLYVYDDDSYVIFLNMHIEMCNFGASCTTHMYNIYFLYYDCQNHLGKSHLFPQNFFSVHATN
jgi:hypothetical protein